MILLITVLFGVLVACVVFYFIGNSLHLFPAIFWNNTAEYRTDNAGQNKSNDNGREKDRIC